MELLLTHDTLYSLERGTSFRPKRAILQSLSLHLFLLFNSLGLCQDIFNYTQSTCLKLYGVLFMIDTKDITQGRIHNSCKFKVGYWTTIYKCM